MFKLGPIRNIEKVDAFIKSMPRGTIRAVVSAFAEYIAGNSKRGLRHDSPYKYVSRKKAYGQTFQSDAQRRYVMGAIARGDIVPGSRKNNPTNASGGYNVEYTNKGYNAKITNDEAGAYWTRTAQPAQLRMVGWKSTAQIVASNMKGAMRSATAAANKWLKEHGKK